MSEHEQELIRVPNMVILETPGGGYEFSLPGTLEVHREDRIPTIYLDGTHEPAVVRAGGRRFQESHLHRIEHKLDRVIELLEVVVSTQQDLDAALSDLANEVTAAVAALEAKAGPDLSGEVAQVKAATQNLVSALTPAPEPQPAPEPVPAATEGNVPPGEGTQTG